MPAITSVLSQMFPGKPKWSVDEIPDLSGKVMIVTGGNTGIGRETVKVCHLFDDAVVCFTSRPLVSGLAAT